ncbi:cyclase [Romeria aff. gracilis LEGE 07310]|uniref:Cyclase n=1 Tax=Vasconcelosia minhoensis LEGE 07310 TaxID=915328 RepID=A0A8J7AKK0_9CYAN|nr:SRPBCC family protein [Romeria gracilis]MBE9076860.1 cyclase [Romeria aff. gracilis LEGE 07310]
MVPNSAPEDLTPQPPAEALTAEYLGIDPAILDRVDITTEKLPARQRRILAAITIPQPLEQVWQVLTDYDRLADFIPNLTTSRRLPHPEGGIRLEQIGAQCFLNIKFCARVVIDMSESFPKELSFSLVSGDFKAFDGAWRLSPAEVGGLSATRLSYDLVVQPPRAMPAKLIERHLCHNLTENLVAIRQHAIAQFSPA